MVAEWCGARKGRARVSSPRAIRPATEWTMEVSSSSAAERGGRRPGRRAAIIDFPAPGGPVSRRLWPPAAAISRARRAVSWPRTSRRSGAGAPSVRAPGSGGESAWVPRKWLTRATRLGGARIGVDPDQAASGPLASGQIRPRPRAPAATAAGRAPAEAVMRPSRDNSPMAAQPSRASGGITPMAAITARAMGRS